MKWGIKKNTRRGERTEILKMIEAGNEDLASAGGVARIGPIRVSENKLGRWKKEAQGMVDLQFENEDVNETLDLDACRIDLLDGEDCIDRVRNEPIVAEVGEANDLAGEDELLQQNIMDGDRQNESARALERLNATLSDPEFANELGVTKSFYDAADIPNSPKLSRLLAAMKIDLEVPSMSLDESNLPKETADVSHIRPSDLVRIPIVRTLDINQDDEEKPRVIVLSRKRPRRSRLSQSSYFQRWFFRAVQNAANPLDEIDLFPNPRFVDLDEDPSHSVLPPPPLLPLQQQRIEGEAKLQKLERMFSPGNWAVIEAMEALGHIYYDLDLNASAEKLYLKVAAFKAKTLGDDHEDTLWAYLNTVQATFQQGRYTQAETLHRTLHSRILNHVASDSLLARRSVELGADIQYEMGRYRECECRRRELLQMCLSKFGLRDESTWDALRDVAADLEAREEWAECGHLLITAHQLQLAISSISETSNYYYFMRQFASNMLDQGEYEESHRLLMDAFEQSKKRFGGESRVTLLMSYELGRCLRLQGELHESEEILRDTLTKMTLLCGPLNKETTNSSYELALTLMKMEHWQEATTLLEQVYLVGIRLYGLEHHDTILTRKTLEERYEGQGLDDDTVWSRLESLEEQVEYETDEDEEEGFFDEDMEEEDGSDAEEEAQPAKRYRAAAAC